MVPMLAGVGLAAAGVAYWAHHRKPALRNVILISIDTLRADHLSYTGYERPTSPNIDRLASESIDFRKAFSHASSTLPGHASMFTSLYPSVHRAEIKNARPLADEYTTLAEIFSEHGFRTAAFVEGGQLATIWNLDQGFETYDVTEISSGDRWLADDLVGILGKAKDWIRGHRDEPFFCFVHSYVVHFPYTPRPPYDSMFTEGYDGPLPRAMTYKELEPMNDYPRRPDEPDVRHVAALYDGEIRYMDQHVGEFIDSLDEMGLADDTVLVFVSDHGEEFAEHGRVAEHVRTLFDEVLYVPLLIRVPGMRPRRIDRQVRLVDLAPSLLALMNIDPGDVPFQGRNLFEPGAEAVGDLPVFSELVYPEKYVASLRVENHKLVLSPENKFELYDLDSDPQEQEDVFSWEFPRVATWVEQIEKIMADNRMAVKHLAAPVELSPDVERQLRALGYLGK
jgi:arylsulfatase A-like enzyme